MAHANSGGIAMGHSAGAVIWGAATLSSFASEDEPEPMPMLNWLVSTVVVPHHRLHPDDQRLRAAAARFPGLNIVAITHEAAVSIDENNLISEICPGEPGVPSQLVTPDTRAVLGDRPIRLP